MEFNSPFISFSQWQEKQAKIAKFFGPKIEAAIAQPEKDRIELALIKVNDN
jgi:hypothetical protein